MMEGGRQGWSSSIQQIMFTHISAIYFILLFYCSTPVRRGNVYQKINGSQRVFSNSYATPTLVTQPVSRGNTYTYVGNHVFFTAETHHSILDSYLPKTSPENYIS
jgi:hypothetical protein